MWIPLTFIFLFASGFIAARFGVQDAEPFTLLLARSLLVLPILLLIIKLKRKPAAWGSVRARWHQIGIGTLLHGAYLGGVFAAIEAGMTAGLTALLVSLHPLATVALSKPLFGIRITLKQWVGLFLGAVGVVLVLSPNLASNPDQITTLSVAGLLWCLVSLLGISLSTLWQKHSGGQMGMVEGLVFQYIGAGCIFIVAAAIIGSFTFHITPRLLLTLAWLVIAISVGAIWLLMLMIERGEAPQVARLFFLVPPCAAFMAWILFDETWSTLTMVGAAMVILSLALDRPKA